MNAFPNFIDTDAGIGTILGNFDTAYIMHVIYDSLNMRFRPFSDPMPNYVDILNRQFNATIQNAPDYKDKIEEVKLDTYKEIISAICSYYNLSFTESYDTIQPMEIYGIARTMYDIFIARFTDYIVNFYTDYIINNIDSIYVYLMNDENIRKVKVRDKENAIDTKFSVVQNNINKVIINMTSYDISFEDLINHMAEFATAKRITSLLADNGDIYKNHYAIYLQDERFLAEMITCIKLGFQNKLSIAPAGNMN